VVLPTQECATQTQQVRLHADDDDLIQFGMGLGCAVPEQSDHTFERGVEYEAKCHVDKEVPVPTATLPKPLGSQPRYADFSKRDQLARRPDPDDLPRTLAMRSPR
jgi:hypothetical protein